MTRRILDAAIAAGKVAAWSDLDDNSDNENTIESKDFDDFVLKISACISSLVVAIWTIKSYIVHQL